ncbi:hypothetical protein V6N13_071803 [Hibiscus sabdariffa]
MVPHVLMPAALMVLIYQPWEEDEEIRRVAPLERRKIHRSSDSGDSHPRRFQGHFRGHLGAVFGEIKWRKEKRRTGRVRRWRQIIEPAMAGGGEQRQWRSGGGGSNLARVTLLQRFISL